MDAYIGDMILFEAIRPVQIRENDKVVELPMIQAILRSLSVSALKGSHRAQIAVAKMVQATQERVMDTSATTCGFLRNATGRRSDIGRAAQGAGLISRIGRRPRVKVSQIEPLQTRPRVQFLLPL
jgi:hypothetical protein